MYKGLELVCFLGGGHSQICKCSTWVQQKKFLKYLFFTFFTDTRVSFKGSIHRLNRKGVVIFMKILHNRDYINRL